MFISLITIFFTSPFLVLDISYGKAKARLIKSATGSFNTRQHLKEVCCTGRQTEPLLRYM